MENIHTWQCELPCFVKYWSVPALGTTYSSIRWVPIFFSPGVKRPERDVDHSALSSSEMNNEWGSNTTSSLCLHGIGRDDFAFYKDCEKHSVESVRIVTFQ
jgi:hypothetical protein